MAIIDDWPETEFDPNMANGISLLKHLNNNNTNFITLLNGQTFNYEFIFHLLLLSSKWYFLCTLWINKLNDEMDQEGTKKSAE